MIRDGSRHQLLRTSIKDIKIYNDNTTTMLKTRFKLTGTVKDRQGTGQPRFTTRI